MPLHGEDKSGNLGADDSGGFDADAQASTNQDDGLPEQLPFMAASYPKVLPRLDQLLEQRRFPSLGSLRITSDRRSAPGSPVTGVTGD